MAGPRVSSVNVEHDAEREREHALEDDQILGDAAEADVADPARDLLALVGVGRPRGDEDAAHGDERRQEGEEEDARADRRAPPLRPAAQELREPEAGAGSDQDSHRRPVLAGRGEIEPARHPDQDAGRGDAQERRQPAHDWRARPGVLPLRRTVVRSTVSSSRPRSVMLGSPRWVGSAADCARWAGGITLGGSALPRPPGRAAWRRTRRSRARRGRPRGPARGRGRRCARRRPRGGRCRTARRRARG